jgi:hypothetical protein
MSLGPVVQVASNLLALGSSEFLQGGSIGPQTVGDDRLWPAVALRRFLDELQGCSLVPFLVTKDSSTSPSWSTARQR